MTSRLLDDSSIDSFTYLLTGLLALSFCFAYALLLAIGRTCPLLPLFNV